MIRRTFILFLPCIALTAYAVADDAPDSSPQRTALNQLLDGVKEIAAPGVPGTMVAYGPRAFPVVVGGAGKKDLLAPVVSAGQFKRGRVVAFGHTGYFSDGALGESDTRRLVTNAICWTARRSGKDKPIRVALLDGNFASLQKDPRFSIEKMERRKLRTQLKAIDVLVCKPSKLPKIRIKDVLAFVRKGGGLLVAETGWGWLQLNPGKTLDDNRGNRILNAAGIAWSDGTVKRTSESGFDASRRPPAFCHAAQAFDMLTVLDKDVKASEAEIRQASWTATSAARVLPRDDELLRPRMMGLLSARAADLVPTKKDPISTKKPLKRFLLALQIEELRRLPAEEVKAHPAAEVFPGKVPVAAKFVTRDIELDGSVPGWQCTGLYAAPGRALKIEVEPDVADAKISIRIGAHSDRLWNKDDWWRIPEIVRAFPVKQTETQAASAFGGLVYVDIPRRCRLGTFSIKIRGAVRAPHFVLGKTSLKKWKSIRRRYAPWAELSSDKIALTVPSRVIRKLDDPIRLMTFWDRVADSAAELATRPLKRDRPERFVTDVQISAGYMHSGYPIMTHLDVAETIVNVDRMMANSHGGVWGFFHELGHNHQHRDWTFGGTGEVTCNLFTLYAYEKVCNMSAEETGRGGPEYRKKQLKPYFEAGTPFKMWKRKPFLALEMYKQLQEAFGWEAYITVFAEYRDLPDGERPKNDDEKRDQWMVRMSRTVGKNLGPFFETWGVPTSEAARESIKDLPTWMPKDFPPKFDG